MDNQEIFDILKSELIKSKLLCVTASDISMDNKAFVLGNPGDANSVFPVFDPKIVNKSEEMFLNEESCYSSPGLFLKVKRHKEIRCRYAGLDGTVSTIKFEGVTAGLFQQAVDSLDGISFTRRANRYHLDLARRQKKKLDRLRAKRIK